MYFVQQYVTEEEFNNLPNFLKVYLVDGKIYTDKRTTLLVDPDVMKISPSDKIHVTYRLSLIDPNNIIKKGRNSYILPYGWNVIIPQIEKNKTVQS